VLQEARPERHRRELISRPARGAPPRPKQRANTIRSETPRAKRTPHQRVYIAHRFIVSMAMRYASASTCTATSERLSSANTLGVAFVRAPLFIDSCTCHAIAVCPRACACKRA
jgi:hypothetical protein